MREEKREGENILLHPSVSAFLGDKNMACQSQSRVKKCVCVREKDVQSANGAGVQNRLLITCVSTHRAMCVRDSCSDSNRMQKMRLIID